MALDDRDVVGYVAGHASGGSTMRPYTNLRICSSLGSSHMVPVQP